MASHTEQTPYLEQLGNVEQQASPCSPFFNCIRTNMFVTLVASGCRRQAALLLLAHPFPHDLWAAAHSWCYGDAFWRSDELLDCRLHMQRHSRHAPLQQQWCLQLSAHIAMFLQQSAAVCLYLHTYASKTTIGTISSV
jgi:hypothetical protein